MIYSVLRIWNSFFAGFGFYHIFATQNEERFD
ncbi:hypothetical protein CLV81_1836 [Flagellimonas meridianipacifica]|uniref:Uncharacterized protein n=1 Tax=Flagellimonas meridianipacifica TaxID=1080225 RepID=A0A2T0MJT0_9FLAO|nr:hypothetical protein CLV81_1836 [Allomuricauda pacifica]